MQLNRTSNASVPAGPDAATTVGAGAPACDRWASSKFVLVLAGLLSVTACNRSAAFGSDEGALEHPDEEPYAVTVAVSLETSFPGGVAELVGQTSSIHLPHCSLLFRSADAFIVTSEAEDPEVFAIAFVDYDDGSYFSGGGDGVLASAYETPEQIGDALPVHAAFDAGLELYRIAPYETNLIQLSPGAPAQLEGETLFVSYEVDVEGETYTVSETHEISVEAPVSVEVQPPFGCD